MKIVVYRVRIYNPGQFRTPFSHMMRSSGIGILPPDFAIGKEADDIVEKMSEQDLPTAVISSQQRLNRLLEREHLREKLFNALKIGDIDGVKRILELAPQLINATDDNGDSLLHYIAAIGIPGIAGHLIEQGAVVNVANNNDHTPLMLAANADNLALFIELLAHQPYLTTTELSSIFHILAQSRSQSSVSMMRALLRRGLQQRLRLGAIPACEPVILPTTQNSQSVSGLTLLHEAVIAGNVPMVIEILNARIIHVDTQDEEGNTALHYAVAIDNTEGNAVVAALLSHEASINIPNNLGDTPLHNAVYRSNCTILTTLLNQRGRNTNVVNNRGNTPLFAACQCTNSAEVIQLLMPVSSLLNAQGQTPLHILAQITENIEMLEAVINTHTVDLDATDDMGNTALHIAVNANNEDAVLALVSENANVDKPNSKTGKTPKDIARERSDRQEVLDILDRGEP